MQIETQSTSRPAPRPSHSTSTQPPASAFSEVFLGKLRLVARLAQAAGDHETGAEPSTQREAVLSGPFTVCEVHRPQDAPGHALVRPGEAPQPTPADHGPAAVLERRDEALRLAAVLPAVAAPALHQVGDKLRGRGVTLHHGRRFVGHLAPAAGRLSPQRRRTLASHLDLARYLAAHPHALAMILESAGPEALPILGRALARRVEALLRG